MILLHNIKGDVRLDNSKNVSVHVSTCTIHNFNALSVVWKLHWCMCMCCHKNEWSDFRV